jgi:NADH-quinone oxidoreductase subunit K
MMGAEFLAMICHRLVGAVAVLFLFVVMMLDVDFAAAAARAYLQYLPVGALIGFVFLLELVLWSGAWAIDPQLVRRRRCRSRPRGGHDNTQAYRAGAYTQYFYFFQAAGLILLVAMIGAIVLTLASGRGQAPGHLEAERAAPRDGDRGAQSAVPPGHLRRHGMIIGLGHYLTVAAMLFTLGVFGIFLNRKNVIVILMSIELILLAVNINMVAFSTHLNDIVGQVFALLILTVAAAEAAIGLAILVVFFRNRGSSRLRTST